MLMWSYLPFATAYLHATGLAWDEIIPITLIGLTIVAGLVLFLLARRFGPGDEEQEAGENN
jgi:hypothetical protein